MAARFQKLLDNAVLDGGLWPRVCDNLADLLGGVGSVLVPLDRKKRGNWMAHSASLDPLLQAYFKEGWRNRDFREAAIPTLLHRGFATDYDIADHETLSRHPFYADFLRRHGLGTYVGIHVNLGNEGWVAAVMRPFGEGPLDSKLVDKIPQIRSMLNYAARASSAIGSSGIETWRGHFENSESGVMFIEHSGSFGKMNAAADRLLSPYLVRSRGPIRLPDPAADRALQHLLDWSCSGQMTGSVVPVIWRNDTGRSLVFDAFKIPRNLAHFHTDVAAMMVVRAAEAPQDALPSALAEFGLLPSEVRVAIGIAKGMSPNEIAAKYSLSVGTVRQQLKSVYRKTCVNSQSRLGYLINTLH